jgi:hypothetical protein
MGTNGRIEFMSARDKAVRQIREMPLSAGK